MRVKIQKRQHDIIADYMREKDIHAFRYKVFEYFINTYAGNIILYVDTNNKIRNLQIEDIRRVMEDYGLDFLCEPVKKSQSKIFDLGKLFKKSIDNVMSEYMILAHVGNDTPHKGLYDNFLKYFDYGLGVSESGTIHELLISFKSDPADVLFNKGIFSVSLYDSILYCRTRTDAQYPFFDRLL